MTAIRRLLEASKVNKICLSSGVLSADTGTADVEADNLFSLFIVRSVISFVVVLHLLVPKPIGLSDGCNLCGNLVAYGSVLTWVEQ